MHTFKLSGVAVLATLAALTAACGSSSGGGGSPSPAGNSGGATSSAAGGSANLSAAQAGVAKFSQRPAKILQTVSLPRTPPRGKRVDFLVATNPAGQIAAAGAQQAAAAVGWNYTKIEYDAANPATLQTAFASALANHPTVVIETGLPQTQFGASTLANYAKAGVPIIDAASPVTPTSEVLGPVQGPSAFVSSGQGLADWVVADSKGHAKVLVETAPGYPVLGEFGKAFDATVAQLCSTCEEKNLPVSLSVIAAGGLVRTVVTTLKANPSIDYVVFDDADFAIGITSALDAAGLNNVKVAGEIMDPTAAAALRSGTESAWMGWNGYYQGYAAIDMALRWVEKVPLTSNDAYSPTQLLTRANIGSTTEWAQPSNALQQFEALWKVPVSG